MSLASGVNNPAIIINDLVQSSCVNEYDKLKWISCRNIIDILSTQINNVYYAPYVTPVNVYCDPYVTLVLLGSSEECTPALVSEFARIYSFPTHKYKNNVSQY